MEKEICSKNNMLIFYFKLIISCIILTIVIIILPTSPFLEIEENYFIEEKEENFKGIVLLKRSTDILSLMLKDFIFLSFDTYIIVRGQDKSFSSLLLLIFTLLNFSKSLIVAEKKS